MFAIFADTSPVVEALPLDRASGLDTAIDSLRNRFGTEAIQRGTLLGRPAEQRLPTLDD